MPVRTTTCTAAWADVPRRVHIGGTIREFLHSEPQFDATVSSAVLLAKLPPKCVIVDSFCSNLEQPAGITTGSGRLEVVVPITQQGAVGYGPNLTFTTYVVGASFSVATAMAPVRMDRPMVRISISDDCAVQFATLRYYCSTASSVSFTMSFAGWVEYLCGVD